MRKFFANSIAAVSVIAFVMTLGWVYLEIKRPADYPGEGGTAIIWLLAGMLVLIEIVLLLWGLSLRSSKEQSTVRGNGVNIKKVLAFYLCGSCGIGLLSAILFITEHIGGKLFGIIIWPPSFIVQTLSGICGIKLQSDVKSDIIVILFCLIYYLIRFFPLFQIFSMNRAIETKRLKFAKISQALLLIAHILIVILVSILLKA